MAASSAAEPFPAPPGNLAAPVELIVPFAALPASDIPGPSLPRTFWLPIGNCGARGPCELSPVNAGSLPGPAGVAGLTGFPGSVLASGAPSAVGLPFAAGLPFAGGLPSAAALPSAAGLPFAGGLPLRMGSA